MQIDITTQEIWHFIGAFQQVVENARQRIEYEKYAAQKAHAAESDLSFYNVKGDAPHKLADLNSGVHYELDADPGPGPNLLPFTPEAFDPASLGLSALPEPDTSQPLIGFGNDPQQSYPPPAPIGPQIVAALHPFVFDMELPHPGTVAVVMGQWNHLSDNDVMLKTDLGLKFISAAAFQPAMNSLIGAANDLQVVGDYAAPKDVADIKVQGWHALEAVMAVIPTEDDGAQQIDGVPQIMALRGDDATGSFVNGAATDDDMPVLKDHLPVLPDAMVIPMGDDFGEKLVEDGPPDAEQTIITGGNTLINETVVTVSWIDAPVILVGGDALSLNVISQVNVLSESSTVNGRFSTALSGDHPSELINVARDALTAKPVAEVKAEVQDVFPSYWVVTTLDADLVMMNWQQQQNFVMDHDVVSVTFSGAGSFFQLGDNTLVNTATLMELGYGYDMIVIGGDMINMNLIRQMNVLYDSDWVGTGDTAADVQTGQNLLWNQAIVNAQGVNAMVGMDDAYGSMADAVMGGNTGRVNDLVNDPTFEGKTVLNVLHITGDMLTVNMIEQTNILGDNDQVAAMAAEAAMQAGAQVQIITGSNALANIAAINTGGVDSVIHVAGDYYSDALLYQANLIDHTLDGNTGPTALTSEAVLFLADGMIGDAEAATSHVYTTDMTSSHADGLNAVLA